MPRFLLFFCLLTSLHASAEAWLMAPRRQVAGKNLEVLGMAASPHRLVAVGETGFIRYADEPTVWKNAAVVPAGGDLNAVIWTGARFVAVGDDGRVLISSDGSDWSAVSNPFPHHLSRVAARGNTIAIADAAGGVIRTEDLQTWTRTVVQPGSVVTGLALSPSAWVCAVAQTQASSRIFHSTDGITWTDRSPFAGILYNIAFAEGQFVAAGEDSLGWGRAMTSRDGLSWDWRSLGLVAGYHAIARFGSQWFITGDGPAQLSPDGATWTMTDVNQNPRPSRVNAAAEFQGHMITAGLEMLASTDANRWMVRDTPAFGTLRHVTWGHAGYVAVGDESAAVWSADGRNWSAIDVAAPARSKITAIAYGGGVYVASTRGGVMISHDGRHWRRQDFGTEGVVQSVRYLRGQFWAIGGQTEYFGFIWNSPDGVQWTNRTPPGAVKALSDIVDTGTHLFVGGYNGYSTTSSDGVSWAPVERIPTYSMNRLAFANGRIIALTGYGAVDVIVSADGGKTWKGVSAIPRLTWGAIPEDLQVLDHEFVITCAAHFAFSADGETWRVVPFDARAASGFSFTTGDGDLVMVGDNPGRIALGAGPATPVVTTQPLGGKATPGESTTLRFTLREAAQTTVQWFKNGAPIPGATAAELTVTPGGPADVGRYHATITHANGQSASTHVTEISALRPEPRLANVSARGSVGSSDLIAGFVLDGDATVLMRTVGPTLRGVLSDALTDPEFIVSDGGGRPWLAQGNWRASLAAGTVANAAARVGGFPLTGADAATVLTLPRGSFTVRARSAAGRTGSALVELYSLGIGPGEVTNLSIRAGVDAAAGPLIAGFVVVGAGRQTLLIRAIGPTLAAFGVGDAAGNPNLALYNADRVRIADNDDWPTSLGDTAARVGAFPLPPGSRDAALLVSLEPGLYTVHVGATGAVLAEIYRVPETVPAGQTATE